MTYIWAKMTQRERDALVAEKVMEWRNVRNLSTAEPPIDDWWGELPLLRGIMRIPDYTTDISAAWRVVERMDNLKWRLHMSRYAGLNRPYGTKVGWGVDFCHDDADEYCGTEAPTFPEAICLAALKVMGVDVR